MHKTCFNLTRIYTFCNRILIGCRWRPIRVSVGEKIRSISCGKNHSLAVTESGRVLGWGLNGYGQLGNGNHQFILFKPELVPGMESEIIMKAICGPNYSLLLTFDGYIYAFGENTCGQIGNGSTEPQFTPHKVQAEVKFGDIVAHKENDISIAASIDGKYYIWGLANNRRQTMPKVVDISSRSLFDVYMKYAKTKLTFRSILVNNDQAMRQAKQLDPKPDPCDPLIAKIMFSLGIRTPKRIRILDECIDLRNFPILFWTLVDDKARHMIRLIRVFGRTANKVIFASNSDKVYCYGFNRDLSLGLGTIETRIRRPKLNRFLSYKQLIDFASGFEHCIGLTVEGKCYAWGQNRFGQLGIGGTEASSLPVMIEDLSDVKVVQICCGAYHTMALTSDGDVFSWGYNTFAQLGDRSYNSRDRPTQVLINERLVSISSGSCHSLALTELGQVYVWGNNTRGQLGRDPTLDDRGRNKPMANRPVLLKGLHNDIIKKAICGPNHCLLLTIDGYVYAFGENEYGQIGNGTTEAQLAPYKLVPKSDLRMNDIATGLDDNLSIAVSDNKAFIWGFVEYKSVLRPKHIPEAPNRLLDIFAKYSVNNKVTYRTVVVNNWDLIKSQLKQEQCKEHDFETEFTHIEIVDHFNSHKNVTYGNLDSVVDIKLFPILKTALFNENSRNTIRLLQVFGYNGSKAIFITNEDKVYSFGNNSDFCLGLDIEDTVVHRPKLNGMLSGKKLINIACGEHHCIGLSSSGRCFAWGQNNFGQLGIGKDWYSKIPVMIVELSSQIVVQVSCGANHTMALTYDKKVYAWGLNELGQLGDKSFRNRLLPIYIPIKHAIVSISCGLNHSMALIDFGLIYIWGHNEFGQLGRDRDFDYKPCCKNWVSFYPCPSNNFKNVQFIKAVCGANHTMLLTREGNVYAFGDNTYGQIGNGKIGQQFHPIKINRDIIFKDIFVSIWNNMSIGIALDNKVYVWGVLDDNKKVLSPKLVPGSDQRSIFNVYVKCAQNKVTLSTIVVGRDLLGSDSCDSIRDSEKQNELKENNTDNKLEISSELMEENVSSSDDQSSDKSLMSSASASNNDSNPANISAAYVRHSFNNRSTSDLKFNCGQNIIYCHKTILEIRNKKFWRTVGSKVSADNEIAINSESHKVFKAFLQYIYGLEPEIDETIVSDLQTMAKYFEEPQLSYLCSQYIKYFDRNPNLSNVCSLFEKAVNQLLPELEKSCVEFAANNWKSVVKSDGFEAMDASLSKRLMCAVFKPDLL